MKILMSVLTGSHLHQLNREGSDEDYVKIFMPSMRDLFFKNEKTLHTVRPTRDVKLTPFNVFVQQLQQGAIQTVELFSHVCSVEFFEKHANNSDFDFDYRFYEFLQNLSLVMKKKGPPKRFFSGHIGQGFNGRDRTGKEKACRLRILHQLYWLLESGDISYYPMARDKELWGLLRRLREEEEASDLLLKEYKETLFQLRSQVERHPNFDLKNYQDYDFLDEATEFILDWNGYD